jgi:hypothetical protein
MKTKLLYVFLLIFCMQKGQAQQPDRAITIAPDTIFVYDTLRVTDTIWLPDPGIPRNALPVLLNNTGLKEKSSDFLIFSPDGTATLYSGRIIDSTFISHLNNSESMKKIGFWGIFLFALQHMVAAQNHLYLNAGTDAYQMIATGLQPSLKSKAAAGFSFGAGFRRDLIAQKLSVGGELNAHLLLRSDFDSIISGGQFAGFPNPLVDFEDQSRNHWMFNLPLSLQWKINKLGLALGGECYYKISPQKGLVAEQDGSVSINNWRTPYVGFSLLGGLEFSVSARTTLGLHYFHGLSNERRIGFNGVQVNSQMRRLELRARYFLF